MHQAGFSQADPSPRLTLQPPPTDVDTLFPQPPLPPKPVLPPDMVVLTGNAVHGQDKSDELPKLCQRCSRPRSAHEARGSIPHKEVST